MAIWLTQCLCEHRHCIIAGAFDDASITVAEGARDTEEMLTQMVALKLANPWCRICRSGKFHYETGRTPFTSMDEAGPALLTMEALNIGAGDLLEKINAAHRRKAN
ncbi:MAG TPA: hypothetical protein VGQ52_13775 [Gemmatimonadaceae bacterium]|jgi:hypothetical protein|nr:hypothetical protein [Gemmatimonadaceae bacterium]